jgi:hypothetical protein
MNAVPRFSFYSNAYYFHKDVFNAKRRKLLLLQEMYIVVYFCHGLVLFLNSLQVLTKLTNRYYPQNTVVKLTLHCNLLLNLVRHIV